MTAAKRHCGFTLLESLIASTVLAVAVLAVCSCLSAGHMQGHEGIRAQRATGLAEEMMETLLALPYFDPQGASSPGPEGDEVGAASFDNMDDYHGYRDASRPILDRAGNPYPDEYQGFTRSVTAVYVNQAVPDLGGTIPGLVVTVTVQSDSGPSWSLTRFVPQPAG